MIPQGRLSLGKACDKLSLIVHQCHTRLEQGNLVGGVNGVIHYNAFLACNVINLFHFVVMM